MIQTGKVLRGAPWQVVIFSLGMYLVVYGLRNAGLTDHLAALLDRTAQGGVWGAAFGTGIIAAVLSSVMNNMPTVLVGALSIDAAHATGAIKEAMIYANVIGCDLGPKLTPIGSLATLLWLHVLGQKGVRIGWGYYFRVGVHAHRAGAAHHARGARDQDQHRVTRMTAALLDPGELAGLAWFLDAASLPSADLAEPDRMFFRFEAESLVGYGGLEGEGPDRLLRSIVILADRRGHGLGQALVATLEQQARDLEVEALASPDDNGCTVLPSARLCRRRSRCRSPGRRCIARVFRAVPRVGRLSRESSLMPLRTLHDPETLPALDPAYAIERPALGLGSLDPAPRILLLYGSLRERSFSRLCVEEAARLLRFFGCETRIFDPSTLPLPDQHAGDDHPAVHELRELSLWSEGQVWCSPERHGQITGIMKLQIDHLPLSMGGMRPTQGRTLAVMQVSAGSQSFNSVNTLRVLGRWMRMVTIPNQSSVAKAFNEFDEAGRMKPSSYYDRIVDVMEELVRFTVLLRPHAVQLVDRYSERKEAGVPIDTATDLSSIATARQG